MPKKSVRKPKKKPWKETVEEGYKFTNGTRSKMSKSRKGRKLSQETKDKISEARRLQVQLVEMGMRKPFKHSEDTKKHLSKVMKRKKHRPTKRAIKTSATQRSALRKDRDLVKKVMGGKV